MLFSYRFLRVAAVCVAVVYLPVSTIVAAGQVSDTACAYNREEPSIKHARVSFTELDYECARQELQDFLAGRNLTPEQETEAWFLLSAVQYYALFGEDSELIKTEVITAGKAALRLSPGLPGELDIDDPEYLDWMQEARQMALAELAEESRVRQEQELQEEPEVAPATPPAGVTAADDTGEGKKWYKKWWVVGAGVALVVGAVAVLAGGGDDGGNGDDNGDDNLPDFPPPPEGKR